MLRICATVKPCDPFASARTAVSPVCPALPPHPLAVRGTAYGVPARIPWIIPQLALRDSAGAAGNCSCPVLLLHNGFAGRSQNQTVPSI